MPSHLNAAQYVLVKSDMVRPLLPVWACDAWVGSMSMAIIFFYALVTRRRRTRVLEVNRAFAEPRHSSYLLRLERERSEMSRSEVAIVSCISNWII